VLRGTQHGALTGARTVTAGMAAVQEGSSRPVAVLGYTPAHPVANIPLTTWGTIMVLVVAGYGDGCTP